MCEAKFTKGEWGVKRTVISDFRVKVKDKKGEQGKIIGDIRMKANAHLIAVAPEMYGLLIRLEKECEMFYSEFGEPSCGQYEAAFTEIRKLLAKARGEHA